MYCVHLSNRKYFNDYYSTDLLLLAFGLSLCFQAYPLDSVVVGMANPLSISGLKANIQLVCQ